MSTEDEEAAVAHQEVGVAMNLAEAIEVDPLIVEAEATEAEAPMTEVKQFYNLVKQLGY